MSQVLFLSSDHVLKEKNIEILQQSGLEATGMSGCLDGLVLMDKNNFDVIVIDDELSDVSGYEACLKVRQQQGALIVLLGTITDADAWSRVEELGFDLYLRKPISPRELLARIKALLRRPGAGKEVVDAEAVKPLAAPPPKEDIAPARTEAIPASPKVEEKEAYTPTAARQPVPTPEPAHALPATPQPEVRGPVYSQRPPGPVEPEIDIHQRAYVCLLYTSDAADE